MTENVNVLRHKANSAIEAAVLSVEAMAAEKERAKIAAWFRHTAECIRKDADDGLWHPLTESDVQKAIDEHNHYADCIETGEYLK